MHRLRLSIRIWTLLFCVACSDADRDRPGAPSGGMSMSGALSGQAGAVALGGASGAVALSGAGGAIQSAGGTLGRSGAGALGGTMPAGRGGSAPPEGGASVSSGALGIAGVVGAAGFSGMLGGAGAVSRSGAAGAGTTGSTSSPFVLTSTAFAEGETIALKYRCGRENVSPPLSWTPGPPGTKSYAVTMLRAAVPHWALYDIPASVLSLPEDIAKVAEPPIPAGSKQVKPNVDGSTWFGYSGPCPSGTQLRTYDFFVYALSLETLSDVTGSSTILQAEAAIRAKSLASATLIGVGRASDR